MFRLYKKKRTVDKLNRGLNIKNNYSLKDIIVEIETLEFKQKNIYKIYISGFDITEISLKTGLPINHIESTIKLCNNKIESTLI